ncbi:uncharacterized protein LOC135218303 [Macrobrachium nipponense]|uniref:uncharacterized protein LOC135218303 n=1 Tax=Macrobrachium nipponense TaxID=159736 RepID=UPI0030C88E00
MTFRDLTNALKALRSSRTAFGAFIILGMVMVAKRREKQDCTSDSTMALDDENAPGLSKIEALLKGPLNYDDPHLLEIIRKKYLIPPSAKSYDLMIDRKDYKAGVYNSYFELEPSFVTLRDILYKILKNVRDGFFVEAGAVDGEFLSNSLMIERRLKWKGLLVEADGDMFKKLLSRNRKAWASHSCLALHSYPHREVFIKYSAKGDLIPGASMFSRGHGVLAPVEHLSPMRKVGANPENSDPLYDFVQCLPLASLLLALNVTHVHFISLDVEGAEPAILDSLPWDVITVDVWLVEHISEREHPENYQYLPKDIQRSVAFTDNLVEAFMSRGYTLYPVSKERLKDNYIFIRKNSEIYENLNIL